MSYVLLFGRDIKRKQLAVATILAVFLHFIAGNYGANHRYEIYIWSFLLIVGVYLFAPSISKYLVTNNKSTTNLTTAIIFAVGVTITTSTPYIYYLSNLPIASNNIYEQQYQMHRYVVDYYKMPVAVNDLGYVSYNNSIYVLDIWGLGSEEILNARLGSNNFKLILKNIIDEKNIGLVMIYEGWFKELPDECIKIGKLHLSKQKITPSRSWVDFYATSQDAYLNNVKK